MNAFQRLVFYTLIFASTISSSSAQDFGGFNFFRGIIASARVEQARDEWDALPERDRSCIARVLASRNTDIPTLISSGILPRDRRLRSVFTLCRQPDEAKLQHDFACELPGEDGKNFDTKCNQSFAKKESDGHVVPVSPKEANDLRTAGTEVVTTNVETDEGKQQRREKIDAQSRTERLRTLQNDLGQYLYSQQPTVRSRALGLKSEIERQLSANDGSKLETVERLAEEVSALEGLAKFEVSRQTAVQRLSDLKANAERDTSSGEPPAFNGRLQLLRQRFTRLTQIDKPASTVRAGGPTFDCSKSETTLPKLICGDRDLRLLDLEITRPFYVLKQLFPTAAKGLHKEADDLSRRTAAGCRLPASLASTSGGLLKKLTTCVAAMYRRQKQIWDARVDRGKVLSAQEELRRSLQQHVQLQQLLKDAGVLAENATADGVYGGDTRRALLAFEQAEGLPTDGFMSDAVAERLTQRFGLKDHSGADSALLERVTALSADYETYLADLASADRERRARADARGRLSERQASVERLISGPIPVSLRSELAALQRQIKTGLSVDPVATLGKIDDALTELKPRTDEAEAAIQVVSKSNRFLFAGNPQDILILYNSTPNATSVTRGLDGKLVFDLGKAVFCSLPSSTFDRTEQQQIHSSIEKSGIPATQMVAACKNLEDFTPDILMFHRSQLEEKLDTLIKVAAAVTSGTLSSLATISADEVRAASVLKATEVARVEAYVAAGTPEGSGFIALDNGSLTICSITNAPDDPFLKDFKSYKAQLSNELSGEPKLSQIDRERAFLSSKRSECGSIYGSGRDLDLFAKALSRDKVSYRFLSIWFRSATSSAIAASSGNDQAQKAPAQQASLPKPLAPLQAAGSTEAGGRVTPGRDDRVEAGAASPQSATRTTDTLPPAAGTGAAINRQPASPDASVPAVQEKRVALIIGNSNYRNAPILPNPVRDASAVAKALESDGFIVTYRTDLTREQLIDALAAFTEVAETADWAVVYFAGHGMEIGGLNYVIPVDAKLATNKTVRYETIPLDDLTASVSAAHKLRLVIIDACRANPFANRMRRDVASRAPIRGLARPPEYEAGTMVVYAAKEGEVASDGAGEAGSPFANALVKQLSKPGLEVRRLFDYVRDDVLEATDHSQLPFTYGSLPGTQDFYFRAAKK